MQYIFPAPIWQMRIGQHHADVGVGEQNSRIIETFRQVQVPPGMTKDLAQPEPIFVRWKYGHGAYGDLLSHTYPPSLYTRAIPRSSDSQGTTRKRGAKFVPACAVIPLCFNNLACFTYGGD